KSPFATSVGGGMASTVRSTMAAWVPDGALADTVKVALADGAPGSAVSVSVAGSPAVIAVELNIAVAPSGRPVIDNDSGCATPDVTLVMIMKSVWVPAMSVAEVGATVIENSLTGGGVTVTLAEAECVKPLPLPSTVKLALAA